MDRVSERGPRDAVFFKDLSDSQRRIAEQIVGQHCDVLKNKLQKQEDKLQKLVRIMWAELQELKKELKELKELKRAKKSPKHGADRT